ncbi:hypothetical protein E8E13_009865 [Curvularia kusanoi]|uniref:Uncharacterized protein n=1 Tax=Curvularia kusanoi TaxID=90978 RepID=A0A9P4TIC3_CURKU|nr:hypothetical protein E8E13_009865 [Curvularia kusanoi]
MVDSATSANRLPPDLPISDRSRKFYDGTYKWDSDGFTDEHGVYREFDFHDPLAAPPTPMPPIFLYDDDDDVSHIQTLTDELAQPDNHHTAVASDGAITEPEAPCSEPSHVVNSADMQDRPKTPRTIRRLAIEILSKPKKIKTAPQEQPNKDSKDDSSVVGELADAAPAELSEAPAPEQASKINMPDTPPRSPPEPGSDTLDISPASATSTLSSVPSNLSARSGDVGMKIKGTAAMHQSSLSLPDTPTKASPQSKTNVATRGVAQKINKGTKGTKRAVASRLSQSKRTENSVEDFTLKDLHSGAYMRSGPRRSTRHVKPEAN